MSAVPSVDLTPIGTRRGLPDGGSQVQTVYGWRDGHSAEAKAALAQVHAANANGDAGLHNIEAEQALLGALLFDPDQLENIDFLTSDHLREAVHGRILTVMRSLRKSDRPVEAVVIHERLKEDPALIELGGLRYLADLLDRAPPAPTIPAYAAELSDLAVRRALADVAGEVGYLARTDRDRPAAEIAIEGERRLMEVASTGQSREAWLDGPGVISRAIETARSRDGSIEFGTGLTDVDNLTGGFGRGELTIIGGRPGMFKSGAASAIAKHNARQGKGTAFFSQEMGEEQLGLRLACDLAYDGAAPMYLGRSANPTFFDARRNALSVEHWHRLLDAAETVADWPLLFDVRPGLTVPTIEACARRAIRRWERQGIEPGPVIIDHLGIVRPDKDRKGNRHAEVADISRGLAEMAKRLNVPVIALCQLNRGVEGRDVKDRRPQLSDLRQAGEIEEDARLVIFLYREEYYYRPPSDPDSETFEEKTARLTKLDKVRHRLKWIVAKANNGPLGEVETFCEVACSAIRDLGGAR